MPRCIKRLVWYLCYHYPLSCFGLISSPGGQLEPGTRASTQPSSLCLPWFRPRLRPGRSEFLGTGLRLSPAWRTAVEPASACLEVSGSGAAAVIQARWAHPALLSLGRRNPGAAHLRPARIRPLDTEG